MTDDLDSLSKYMNSNYCFKMFSIISVFCGLNVSSQNLCAEVLTTDVWYLEVERQLGQKRVLPSWVGLVLL